MLWSFPLHDTGGDNTGRGPALFLRGLERLRRHRRARTPDTDAGAPLRRTLQLLAKAYVSSSCLPAQICFSRRFARLRRGAAAKTDVRIRHTNQMVRGSKIMKLLAWEESFMASIFVRGCI